MKTILLVLVLFLSCTSEDEFFIVQNFNLYENTNQGLRFDWVGEPQTENEKIYLEFFNSEEEMLLQIPMEKNYIDFPPGSLLGTLYYRLRSSEGRMTDLKRMVYEDDPLRYLKIDDTQGWPISLSLKEPYNQDQKDFEIKVLAPSLSQPKIYSLDQFNYSPALLENDVLIRLQSKLTGSHAISLEIQDRIRPLGERTPSVLNIEGDYGLSFFQWSSVPGAAEYEIQIYDIKENLLGKRSTANTWIDLTGDFNEPLLVRIQGQSQSSPLGLSSPLTPLTQPGEKAQILTDSRISDNINPRIPSDTFVTTIRNTVFFRTPLSFTPAGFIPQGSQLQFLAMENSLFKKREDYSFIVRVRHPEEGIIFIPSDRLYIDSLPLDPYQVFLQWIIYYDHQRRPVLGGGLSFEREDKRRFFYSLREDMKGISSGIQTPMILLLSRARRHWNNQEILLGDLTLSYPQRGLRNEPWLQEEFINPNNLIPVNSYPVPMEEIKRQGGRNQQIFPRNGLSLFADQNATYLLVPMVLHEPSDQYPTGFRTKTLSMVFEIDNPTPAPSFRATLPERDLFYYPSLDRFQYAWVNSLFVKDGVVSWAENTGEVPIQKPVLFQYRKPQEAWQPLGLEQKE